VAKLSVRNLATSGKRVFVRVDFNVPMTDAGTIRNDSRIRAALPTINLLLRNGATVVLASHLGKAQGRPDPRFTLRPVAERLSQLLGRSVIFAPDCIGPETLRLVNEAPPGSVILLENLRFHPGETENDPDFGRELARLADLYVNDAFGTAHRAHASTAGMAQYFPTPAAGLLMAKEIEYLSRVTAAPVRPYIALIGGAKVSDKAGVIANLLTKVDRLLVGGGVAFNFLKAQGHSIGRSVWEPELMNMAQSLAADPKLKLPTDLVAATNPDESSGTVAPVAAIPDQLMGLDIGPVTAQTFVDAILPARTVVWAGPMGMFERTPFAHGTEAVARAVATVTDQGAVTVVGGGDTVAALAQFGLTDKVSHVSTGGSATLEFLEGKSLPGVAALAEAK